MTLGARIIASLAALCFLAAGIALAFGVQPLLPERKVEILYGEHEDFRADGVAFRKFRNRDLYIVHLPRAGAGRQWWAVDFEASTIADMRAPRSLGGLRYVTTSDRVGPAISTDGTAHAWQWQFTDDSAAFARRSFTCLVRRTGGS